jgi:hypothetical protein
MNSNWTQYSILREGGRTMSMFDLTSEGTFGMSPIEPDEKAISALLRAPALSYIRELRQTIDQDPNFLAFHDRSVGLKVQSLLSKEGIFWDQEVFEKQFLKLVTEAVQRLRTSEK